MSARAGTNTFLDCALLISAFFIHFWKIQAQMWREQEKPQTSIYTHAHNVRTAYCYFVQAVKICPGQRESPQKQQLSCFSEATSVTSGVHVPSTCCRSDMLADRSYFFSLILSGTGPQFLKQWLPNSHHLQLYSLQRLQKLQKCGLTCTGMSSPSGPPVLQLWPFHELYYWKDGLGSASEQKKKKQKTTHIVIFIHFTAIGANILIIFSAAHYCFPFLGLPAAGWPTKISIPWPCDVRAPNVWPVSARNSREKSLQCWCSNRVSGLPREAFCRELALGRYMPVLHLSTYQFKCLAILF